MIELTSLESGFSVLIYPSSDNKIFSSTLLDLMLGIFVGMIENKQLELSPKIYVGSNRKSLMNNIGWLELLIDSKENLVDYKMLKKQNSVKDTLCFKKIMVGTPFGYLSDVTDPSSKKCSHTDRVKIIE